MTPSTGHSVLQLPVPPLEEWVRERTRHHDAGFVSADPRFGHAHVTALAPFAPEPSAADLAAIADIAAGTEPIPVRGAELGQFPDGIIHLRLEPDEPLRALTARLVAAFPQFEPYEGAFGPHPVPHVTLDAATPTVTIESTRRRLGDVLPAVCTLTRLQLAWWESGRCQVLHDWHLGRTRFVPRRLDVAVGDPVRDMEGKPGRGPGGP